MAVRGEVRGAPRRVPAIPARDAAAIAVALVFLVLGFGAIVAVRRLGGVTDGVVLASALILPAILYLLISGRVTDLKGPGGLEISIAEVANRSISVDSEGDSIALAYDQVRSVEGGARPESFLKRVESVNASDPVMFTLKLGSSPINGVAAADYIKGLTQFPRFRFVAILDSHDKLVSYMDERAFRHLIESNAVDAQSLLNNIEQQNVGPVRAYPGMIQSTVGPETSVADALREMERIRTSALLVCQDGHVLGIVEREHLANALLLKIFEHAAR
jgi:hypothetical protein